MTTEGAFIAGFATGSFTTAVSFCLVVLAVVDMLGGRRP